MRARPVLLVGATLLGTAAAGLLVDAAGVRVVEPEWRPRVVLALTLGSSLAGVLLALVARSRPQRAADAGAVAAGLLLAGMGAAALHGTRWGWFGLFADSAFRTQMATRYAESVALVDYGYRDLPAYYPPALGWLQGRLAAVTDLAGWEAVKPVQLVAGALVPVAAYLLWRPVAGALRAAAVAGLVTVWTAHPHKADEWLVLACLVPWWLLAVRDVRASGVDRWPAWRLGLVLGLLLLVHTYWFLPFGVATLLALGYDAARALSARGGLGVVRAPRLPWRRAGVIGAVGLALSAVSWLPALLARLRLPADDLQLRYSHPGGHDLVLPMPVDVEGVVHLAGLAWLGWAAWRWVRRDPDELAGGLALALLGSVATLGLGALAERADVGLLAFKTQDALSALLLTCAVLGGAELLSGVGRWARRDGSRLRRLAAALVPTAVVAVVAGSAGHQVATEWATGPAALVAQTTRYPDGTSPTGESGREPYYPTLFVDPTDPPVTQVRAAWRELRPDVPLEEAVLVTSQVDLLATTPVHGFLAFKSIYSHPNGRFEDRVALLEQVAGCPTPACAADLLRDNDLDPVDGLVLRREGKSLVLPFMVDDFPDRTRREQVAFPDRLFGGEEFLRRELGRIVVVALVP